MVTVQKTKLERESMFHFFANVYVGWNLIYIIDILITVR